jgi:hypothetical protein
MGRLLVIAVLAGAAAVTVVNLPDIQRYLKMRSM